LNKLAGTTATTSDFDKLSNVTASATELNYMSGATSSIQNQLDNISVTSGSLTKSFTNGETASITLSSALSTAPVVGVTKEVAQTGISSKGAWDVNATASNYELHNTAYDTTLTKGVLGYDISVATQDSSFSVANKDNGPTGVTVTNSGLSMYVCGTSSNSIHQYSLSTAYDVSTASFVRSFNAGVPVWDVRFKSDGSVMYYMDNNDNIYQYNLSTNFDISSGPSNGSVNTTTQDDGAAGFYIKPDGTKLYIIGWRNDNVYEYTLSTAGDVTSASYVSSFSVASQEANPYGVAFSTDGTKLFITGVSNQNVHYYSLSTAWDVTSASYVSTFNIGNAELTGIDFSADGSKMYLADRTNDTVVQFSTSSDGLVLGTGSFASTDVGKRIQGNGGDVILTSTAGAYDTTGGSDFTDTSTIASGSWTMHGLKSAGDDDGLTIAGIANAYDIANANSFQSVDIQNQADFPSGMYVKPDGTSFYYVDRDSTRRRVYQFNMSTAYDVTSASFSDAFSVEGQSETSPQDVKFKSDGTIMYVLGDSLDRVLQYTLSTPWNIGTAGYASKFKGTQHSSSTGFYISTDGTNLYTIGTDGNCYQHTMTTAWDISTAGSYVATKDIGAQHSTGDYTMALSDDGTKAFFARKNDDTIYQWNLTTAWDLSTASYSSTLFSTSSDVTTLGGIYFANGGEYLFVMDYDDGPVGRYTVGDFTLPTSQYHIAATNSGGQISTEYWNDINSMTADQSLGDGEAYYAVSTDDRTTWSVAKASDGVRPIVRDNAGTWQYNSAVVTSNYDVASLSYDNKSFDNSAYDGAGSRGFEISGDGTKVYYAEIDSDRVYQYSLSTAWDISTASPSGYINTNYISITNPYDINFNSDGSKAFVLTRTGISIYSLSTAYDIATAGSPTSWTGFLTQEPTPSYMTFNGDGTKVYIGGDNDTAYQYSMSTAYDVSNASYDNKSINLRDAVSGANFNALGLAFNGDGTKFYAVDSGESNVYEWTLSTAYDASTATYNTAHDTGYTGHRGISFSSTGDKMYLLNFKTMRQFSVVGETYTTSTTWTNATTNDEFYALQEALGATSVNRMDKTQLDAVADGSHFTLGDTLDLAIALKQDTASASLPTSDGVSINYDAQALNQGAVLGTDYDYDFPDSTTVRITSNAAQNLKIRVV
jgi:hypothetical protein